MLLRKGLWLALSTILAFPSALQWTDDAVLVQIVGSTTRPFALGGKFLTMPPVMTTTKRPTIKSEAGLVAAETSKVITTAGSSILVVYHQEENSAAPRTSYTSPPPQVTTSSPPPPAVGTLDEMSQKWLDVHNSARAPFGVGNLTWRWDLVEKARKNAVLCTGDHSNAGENIAAQSGTISPELSVKWWMAEEMLYDWNHPGFSDPTGHFTQVVWDNVQAVGCYIAECAAGTVFETKYGTSYQATCEYDPAGNYINAGEFEKNVSRRQAGQAPWVP